MKPDIKFVLGKSRMLILQFIRYTQVILINFLFIAGRRVLIKMKRKTKQVPRMSSDELYDRYRFAPELRHEMVESPFKPFCSIEEPFDSSCEPVFASIDM